ncbi:hypothetical protein ACM66Z_05675 [Sulfurovum sp. ST-21]|uniref:Uncharacterized protein n=1 Tax=Sulfurovum indicum TaxID=2779528 RepID=A0A7M1S0I3_9BACT|nr:hypothetical protein [Sulfurovum indicum]QOR60948.1 hypothetical protein IMZ28_05635 [Sulfurovum indicum]
MQNKTVKELLKKIFKNKQLSQNEQKIIINQALKIAEDSEDYCEIATYVCHNDVLSDKEWGRELFKKALEKSDIEYGTQGLYNIARQVADKSQLNDKVWAKELYLQAINQTDDIDDLLAIADNVADEDDINDKNISKMAIEKALSISSNTSNIIEVIKLIAHTHVLNDKKWAIKLLDNIKNNLDYGSDYIEIATIYSHKDLLNDKSNGRIWFEKSIKIEDSYDDGDYLLIAQRVFDENFLDDKEWAAKICIDNYKNTYDIQSLIKMSKITYQTNQKEAKKILIYTINMIEKDDDYSSDDLFNIAAHISDKTLSNIPFFNDKSWGREVFNKAKNKALTNEDKILIEESMEQYLKN